MSRIFYSLADFESYDPGYRRGTGSCRFLCPECGTGKPRDDQHRSLSYNPQNGLYRCFRCPLRGQTKEHWVEKPPLRKSPFRTRQTRSPQPYPPLGHPSGGALPAGNRPVPPAHGAGGSGQNEGIDDSKWREQFAQCSALKGTPGESYLQSRGIPLPIAQAAGIQFHRAFSGQAAIVFPICDIEGRAVAIQGRFTGATGDRRMMTMGPKVRGAFYTPGALEAAPVLITEAPIDALSLAICGCPALSLCGSNGCPLWLIESCAYRKVGIAFDADEPGDKAAISITSTFSRAGCPVQRLRPIGGKDWNEVLQRQGRAALSAWLQHQLAAI